MSNETNEEEEPEISINASKPVLTTTHQTSDPASKPSEFNLHSDEEEHMINEDLWLWAYEE